MSACSALEHQRLNGPGWYLVKPTDTLYSIAWRYGLDFRQLANWNSLQEPFTIHPGQQLVLIQPADEPSQHQDPVQIAKNKALPRPVVVKSLTPDYNQVVRWRWPTEGKVLNDFSVNNLDQRGIDIAGKAGQSVYAVAAGKVVYSGNGLAGYENLIIVKHSDTFLSAYAYNRKRLVTEGMNVERGTLIAEMGFGKNNEAMLHFQIRKDGQPVDPIPYLPGL
jgi:lipoprotein NlpD